MNTIADEWESFERMVVARDAPAVQRSEMKLAFFGGASAVLALQLRIPQEKSEDASVGMLAGWHDECKRFAKSFTGETTHDDF